MQKLERNMQQKENLNWWRKIENYFFVKILNCLINQINIKNLN